MSKSTIVRAWKDAGFRSRLSKQEQALLPANPAGSYEIAEQDLDQAAGGLFSLFWCTPPQPPQPPAPSQRQFCTTPCTTSLAGCC